VFLLAAIPCRCSWKGAHNAGCLTAEVIVTVRYPFHPLVGQSVLIIGITEHGGARHLIIRKPDDGAKSLIPEWMTFAEAGAIRIMFCPRLSVDRLLELRALIDRLTSPSGQQISGGQHDEMDATPPTRSVEDAVVERVNATSTSESVGAAESASQRSNVRHRSKKPKRQQSGGRR
jgi:Family of unknown function (DUF5372)